MRTIAAGPVSILLAIAAILLTVALGGCGGAAPAANALPENAAPDMKPAKVDPFSFEPDVVLLITGSTRGRMEVCDCIRPEPGGLTTRSGLVYSYRQAFKNVLLIDSGDAFIAKPGDGRNAFLARAYRTIGCDAMALGDHDWQAGQARDFVSSNLAGTVSIGFLGANEVPTTSPTLFAFMLQFGSNTNRIAILSLLGPETFDSTPASRQPPAFILAGFVEGFARSFKEYGYTVVLLAHVTDAELKMVDKVPSADLVIRGHSLTAKNKIKYISGRPMVQPCGADYVGAVALKLDAGKIARIEYRLIPITADWPIDRRLLDIFRAYVQTRLKEPRPSGEE